MLSVDEARIILIGEARPTSELEAVDADNAFGRILAQDIISKVDVPSFSNSAMDGYAVRLSDIHEDSILPISQRICAGMESQPLSESSVARIFTGAQMPLGADAVVIQEDAEKMDNGVRILRKPNSHAHIRFRGEDIRQGHVVLRSGTRLGAAQLGVVAASGVTKMNVYKRLRVAVFFTGDELVMPGEQLPPGCIYNSNRSTIIALLKSMGCVVVDMGIVADTVEDTKSALIEASNCADVVITTGGVSVGDEDHVKTAMLQLGQLIIWKVAMKPGKPLALGNIGDTYFIGLPGNPVSAFIVFCLLVKPFLVSRMGAHWKPPLTFSVISGFEWAGCEDRREYLRARVVDGYAILYPIQGSGAITSIVEADGIVEVTPGKPISKGDLVKFTPMNEIHTFS